MYVINLSLAWGASYFMRVYATNGAGLEGYRCAACDGQDCLRVFFYWGCGAMLRVALRFRQCRALRHSPSPSHPTPDAPGMRPL